MAKYECDNCEYATDEGSHIIPLSDCEGLGERLDPGSVVPAGECPVCKSFMYLHESSADELMHWIASVAEGAKVYIDDDGIRIRALGTNDYYELGGHTPDDEN